MYNYYKYNNFVKIYVIYLHISKKSSTFAAKLL